MTLDWRPKESYSNINNNYFLQGLAGMSIGFCFSTICNTSADAIKLTIAFCIPLSYICSIWWSSAGQPNQWLITVSQVFPHTEAVQGMRGGQTIYHSVSNTRISDIMLRGWGISQSSSILYGILISLAWIVAGLTLSSMQITKKMN